jgi:hypothetical protein
VKRGDLKAIGRSGFDRPGDRYGLLTLTGPGKDRMPWDTARCGHTNGECSGKLGCRVDVESAALWHASLPRRWSWFWTYLRRLLVGCTVEYMKVYEWQERGVLHVHVLFRVEGVCSERRFKLMARSAAARWDFGRQLDVRWISAEDALEKARAAGYGAKYCVKGYDELGRVETLDPVTGELSWSGVRPWSASRSWGLTMKRCRATRAAWWAVAPVGLRGTSGTAAQPPLTCRGIVPQRVDVVPSVGGSVAM